MIVKIKCVENIDYLGLVSTYLTIDKTYDAIISESNEFSIICDEGELINDNLYDAVHGKWEIVE